MRLDRLEDCGETRYVEKALELVENVGSSQSCLGKTYIGSGEIKSVRLKKA